MFLNIFINAYNISSVLMSVMYIFIRLTELVKKSKYKISFFLTSVVLFLSIIFNFSRVFNSKIIFYIGLIWVVPVFAITLLIIRSMLRQDENKKL